MKVLFLVDHFDSDRGGTENQLLKIVNGLARSMHVEMIVFRPSEWLDTHPGAFSCPLEVLSIQNFRGLGTYRNFFVLIRRIRAIRPDVVHCFFPVANSVGVFAARLGGVRTVISSRRDYGEWMNRRYLLVTRLANRLVSGIVSNSKEVKRLTVEVERVPARRIEVIYNGIEVKSHRRSAPDLEFKRQLGIALEDRVVGIVGNFRPMKRHQTFVRAADRILKRRSGVSFLLIGADPHQGGPKTEMQKLVGTLGIGAKVRFSEAHGNIREHLSIIDVAVNCSEREGLSNAVMEYMCSGIPCVVSSSGGNPDLVQDGVTGLTFPLDDDACLAEKIERLLDDPQESGKLATAAYEDMLTRMDLQQMLRHFETFYRNTAGVGAGGM